jgi:hypothetical protein
MVTTWNVSAITNKENADRCLKEKMRRAAEQSLTNTIAKADKKREEEKRQLAKEKAAEEQAATEKRDEEKKREKEKRTKKKWQGWQLGMIRQARGTFLGTRYLQQTWGARERMQQDS